METAMTAKSDATPVIRPEPLVLSRSFHAPRDLVFKAWSSADHIKRWFSPATYTVPDAVVEFRPGGAFEVCMRSSDGQDFWSRGTFVELAAPDRLVFAGSVLVGGEKKFSVRTTVTFTAQGDSTLLSVRQEYEVFDEAFMASISGAPEGWRTTLDKLGMEIERIKLEGAPQRPAVHGSFTLSKHFDAKPAVVFHALTDPVAKARWFVGGESYTTLERQMDVRPGGRERVSGRWTTGLVTTFDAVYFDVVADTRLIYTYEMRLDDRKISVSLATMELEPEGAGTKLTVTEHGVFLDGYDDSGARRNGTADLLDRLAASLQDV
jgi:uncharacterized protein YndB with AHSA1/START domain